MDKSKKSTCPTCGQPRPRTDADRELHRTVERVVRAGHLFGGVRGGGVVLVEERHAVHPSVASATISPREAAALERAARARAAAARPASTQLKDMVDRALAGSQAEVRNAIERGRAREVAAVASADQERAPTGPGDPSGVESLAADVRAMAVSGASQGA